MSIPITVSQVIPPPHCRALSDPTPGLFSTLRPKELSAVALKLNYRPGGGRKNENFLIVFSRPPPLPRRYAPFFLLYFSSFNLFRYLYQCLPHTSLPPYNTTLVVIIFNVFPLSPSPTPENLYCRESHNTRSKRARALFITRIGGSRDRIIFPATLDRSRSPGKHTPRLPPPVRPEGHSRNVRRQCHLYFRRGVRVPDSNGLLKTPLWCFYETGPVAFKNDH